MSPESKPRPAAEPVRGDEEEIELSRYLGALRARWWLVLLAVVIGALIGYLVSVGGGRVYQAKATIYLGQPLSSSGGSPVQTPQTNPTAINQIVKSESVVEQVAAKVGLRPGVLRRGIASAAVSSTQQRGSQSQLVTITVRGPAKQPVAEAANMLADIAVASVSKYVDAKIAQLEARLASQEQQLAGLNAAVERYRAATQDASLSPQERLLAAELLTTAVTQEGSVAQERSDTQLELSQAKLVERAQVVTRAAATKVAARSRKSAVIVGALLGLLVGLLVAFLFAPLVRAVRRGRPDGP